MGEVIFIVESPSDKGKVIKQLSEMHKNDDIVTVITKAESDNFDMRGAIVIESVTPNKENAIILDHAGNTQRHGFPTDQLPEILCNDDKKESKNDKKEPLPKQCDKCFFMKPPKIHKCPQCGHAPEKQNDIENTNDTLEKIEKVETAVKSMWFSMLLYYVRSKGYKDGAASHLYKSKFLVWPHKKTGVHPTPPNEEVKKYITYCNIKRGKSKSWV